MANMDIKTDPVVSFFSLWSYAFDELINPTTDRVFSFAELLKTFSSENIPLLEKTVPSIQNLSVEEKIQLMKNFTRLSSDVCAGRYNSGENLIDDMVDIFHGGLSRDLLEHLTKIPFTEVHHLGKLSRSQRSVIIFIDKLHRTVYLV